MSLTPAERKLVEDFKRDLPEILEGRDPLLRTPLYEWISVPIAPFKDARHDSL